MNSAPGTAPVGRARTSPTRLKRLNDFLARQRVANPFLRARWNRAGGTPARLRRSDELRRFPVLRRNALLLDQQTHPPLGTNRTVAPEMFTRRHVSSGTSGRSIAWADTEAGWERVVDASRKLFELSGVTAVDRVALLSSGASSGPVIIQAGARALGCAIMAPGVGAGAEDSRRLLAFHPTVLAGSSTGLLALGASLKQAGIIPARIGIERLILIRRSTPPETRRELEELWGARSYDRYGCTEAGSLAAECDAHPGGMHLLDEWFIAECLVPGGSRPVADGAPGELVITSLLREEMPLVRYATGDLVVLHHDFACACGRRGTLLGSVRRRTRA